MNSVQTTQIFNDSVNTGVTLKRALESQSLDCNPVPAKRAADIPDMANNASMLAETFPVPENVVGLVIGKGGSEIRNIQQMSGCRVQMNPDNSAVNGFRGCQLQGTLASIEAAKAMINDIIHRNQVSSLKTGNGYGNEQTIEIEIPAEKCGLIIGKAGETIRTLQEQSGCKMAMVQQTQAVTGVPKPLRIIGTPEQVELAKQLVQNVLNNDSNIPRHHPSGETIAKGEVIVPRASVGTIIGKGGEMIKRLGLETGTKIQFKQDDDPTSPERCAVIMGTREQIFMATERITELVNKSENPGAQEVYFMHIPANKTGLVIGKGGETIKQINKETGAHCELSRDEQPNPDEKVFIIRGTPYQIHHATHIIRIKVGDLPPNAPIPPFYGSAPQSQMHQSINQAMPYGQQQTTQYSTSYNSMYQKPQMNGNVSWQSPQPIIQQQCYQNGNSQGIPQQAQQPAGQSLDSTAPVINPATGQPDYSAQWAAYYRSVGLHEQAAMVENQMKRTQQQVQQQQPHQNGAQQVLAGAADTIGMIQQQNGQQYQFNPIQQQ
ncbi:unnamed protein product [Caenorhabditis bovis]|uniref:K Homology domain-containing protein n=1 Tax=Caenorhabditis bovis TaxID=2654633 RepID=A0A8S1EZK8_9PELO|nr:unnamed protein product [Caenorhabditis bovis]